MNVFRTTVVFICFVAAEGNFPAVIFNWQHYLARPAMLKYSETEMEVGFDSKYRNLYAACPLSDYDQSEVKVETNDRVLKHSIQRKNVSAERPIFLDQLPTCEASPRVISKRVRQTGDYITYSIGYEDYRETESPYSRPDRYLVGEVFKLIFNTVTGRTTLVTYELDGQPFYPTASNQKRIVAYEKNEVFLKFDLDALYHNFVDQILPRMEEQKSANQLAHALGIQKVQLATPDDFALDTWKMATYWNINTVPIWRVLLLRWNAIEIYIRKLLKRDINLKVETGASGTLELTEGYYENNTEHKLHIPKYVWKLIPRTCRHKKAMLIIMHNDPFTKNQEPLCADICAINGWLVSNNHYQTGLVYCCEMTENIAQSLGYLNDMKDFVVYSFTRKRNGTEKLYKISRILSDSQHSLYDW